MTLPMSVGRPCTAFCSVSTKGGTGASVDLPVRGSSALSLASKA